MRLSIHRTPLLLLGCVAVVAACGTSSDEDTSFAGTGTDTGTDAVTDTGADVGAADTGGDTDDAGTVSGPTTGGAPGQRPNLLLIVSDDQGLDASAQYAVGEDLPSTPVIDELAANGLVFENAWATPSCTTTRGTLITGQHGVNSGVDTVPDRLDTETLTLQRFLGDDGGADYASAVIGKWHLAGGNPTDLEHPIDSGVDYYAGTLSGVIEDYESWPLTTDGAVTTETTYHTTAMTDLAIDWVSAREDPWFLWLAYVAPHLPFHLPPADLHDRSLSGTTADIADDPRSYYLAAIEAMDAEIGRLLDAMPTETRENTLIVFLGDNGTPTQVVDPSVYPRDHAKNTLYEGGIRVPMVVSGAGVTRTGEREDALVNSTDIYPTFAEVAGVAPPADLDGQSFLGRLGSPDAASRAFNYSEFVDARASGWTVRDDTLKLIEYADGTRELYDVVADPREESNLIGRPEIDAARVEALDTFAAAVRSPTAASPAGSTDGGTADAATGGSGTTTAGAADAGTSDAGAGNAGTTDAGTVDTGAIDITNATLAADDLGCAAYANAYTATATDVATGTVFDGDLAVRVEGDRCVFASDAIPNHDFNDGARAFANPVSEQSQSYSIPTDPVVASEPTPLSLTVDNAILLNGVKVDLLAAACFGVGDERIGCNDPDQPWRFDPMHAPNGFRVDSHNAHTQPDGAYHYHGVPNALYESDGTTVSPVVGFAADGFPIFGSVIDDGGTVRSVRSSYRLRSGQRPSGDGAPGGAYDGTYRDDHEYVSGLGDLDECNGREVDGVYRYHMTDTYPHVLGCFRGTPDDSFIKRGRR